MALRDLFAPGGARSVALSPLTLLVLAQAAFIFVGIEFLAFSTTWLNVALTTLSAVITELVFSHVSRKWHKDADTSVAFPTSAIAAAFGIGIFLRGVHPWVFVLAGFLAIASKYAIRYRGGHVFNPSNFAVTMLAVLLPFAATIEFSQWGNSPYTALAVAAVCFFISYRAGALPTTLSFLGVYTAILLALFVYRPDEIVAHHLGLLGPSLVLFASFMITDPKTAPSRGAARYWHGAGVAFLYFFLELLGVRYALFIASFATALIAVVARFFGSDTLRVRNIPVALLSIILLVCAATVTLRDAVQVGKVQDLSASFLLFGIESDALYRCSDTAAFVQQGSSGIEENAYTYGITSGDFDGDGYVDVFVSNRLGSSSKLYRNTGSGTFTDVTEYAGLPQGHASSALFFDFDNDDDLDLVISYISRTAGTFRALPRLYINTGGVFRDATTELGLDTIPDASGNGFLAANDFDGDGLLDLVFVTDGEFYNPEFIDLRAFERARRDPFFHGRRDVHVACGSEAVESAVRRFSRVFSDEDYAYISSGLLSQSPDACLYYSSAVNVLPEYVVGNPVGQHMLTKTLLSPGGAFLFRNTGARFENVGSFSATIEQSLKTDFEGAILTNQRTPIVAGRFFQPLSFDYDGDGLQDIFLSVDFGSNLLLKNEGSMQFTDVTVQAGLNYQGSGMGADVADWNGDGLPDIYVSNVAHDYLLENQGDGTFTNEYARHAFAVNHVGWGTAFVDFDGDGRDDILTANGSLSEYPSDIDMPSGLIRPLFKTNTLYRNVEGQRFENVSGEEMCTTAMNGKSLAVADYDEDGDPDFILGTIYSGNSLWENTRDARFVSVDLQGTQSNRGGIGAKVTVEADGNVQTKWNIAGDSFGSQSERLIFGVGDAEEVLVRVTWPSGVVTEDTVPVANEVIIRER